MKKKIVTVNIKKDHKTSPYMLRWPKKQDEEIIQQKTLQADIKIRKSPNLLLNSENNQTSMGMIFLRGRPVSLKKIHILLFAILLFILITPFQVQALINSLHYEQQYLISNIQEATRLWQVSYELLQKGNYRNAQESFSKAGEIFDKVSVFPKAQHPFLVSIIETFPYKSKKYQSFKDGVSAGYLISRAGYNISEEGGRISSGSFNNDESVFIDSEDIVHRATSDVLEAHFLVSRIDTTIFPSDFQEDFIRMRYLFDTVVLQAQNIDAIASLFADMAGFDDPKSWLIIFQNNAELRASGGFMGSYGLAKVKEGSVEIVDIPSGGTYDHRGRFRKNVISPDPLHLINPVWEFQDSNWWPDWPASAKKIVWFYEQGNGATVDGVVSITPEFLERILDITGPVALEGEYGILVDKYNVYTVLQNFSERKQDITKEPKKIIGDLTATLLKKISDLPSSEDKLKLLQLVMQSVENRQLLVYWNQAFGESILSDNGWDGSLVSSNADDYLMVVHTNIAGGKSDRSIRDLITLDSEILATGDVKNKLTLTRTHHGKEGVDFSGVRNVDYIRLYVPEGSTLVSAKGFNKPPQELFELPPEGFVDDKDYLALETNKRYDEVSGTETFNSFGKTVFANWLMVDPGKSQSVTLEYILPEKILSMPDAYSFYMQKQSGWQGAQLSYSLTWPEVWISGLVNGSETGGARTVSYQAPITQDIRLLTEWNDTIYAKK